LKHPLPQAVPVVPVVPPSPPSFKTDVKRPIRIESQAQKEKRLAEERAREGESDEKIKANITFTRANGDVVRHQIEERDLRNVEERQLKEEAERAEKERKEAEEWATNEETERQEAEERAAWLDEVCKELEERAAREVREAKEREKERLRPVECVQREAEHVEQEWFRNFRGEEETFRAVGTLTDAASDVKLDLPPEGEVEGGADGMLQTNTVGGTPPIRTASVSPLVPISTGLSAKFSEQGFRFGTFSPSPELSQNRPGSRSPHTALTSNSAPALPSALATARHIEDINCITYPEGIKRPKVELNVYAQKGKFRYALFKFDSPFI
jgi:translation initiation factor 4G